MPRRKRSRMTIDDCHAAFADFAKRVQRFGETSDAGMFRAGSINVDPGFKNVCFLVRGGFGIADPVFEAIRVLAGHKLPAKESADA